MGDDQGLAPDAKGEPVGPADPPTVHLGTGDPSTVHLRTGDPSTVRLRAADPSTVHLRIAGTAATVRRGANLPIVIALTLVLVAALIAIGVRLSSHPVLNPGLARDNHSLREPARLRALLPDGSALPQELWHVESGPSSGAAGDGTPCLLPEATNGCTGQLSYATETFRAGSGRSLQFSVIAYDSPQTAGRAFAALRDRPGATSEPTRGANGGANSGANSGSSTTAPPLGDESAVLSLGADGADGANGSEALVRMADLVIDVRSSGGSVPGRLLAVLTRDIAQRVGRNQAGDHT